MKYCIYCGSEIADEAVMCVHCGRMLNESFLHGQHNPAQKSNPSINTVCLLGFIFSFFASIVGLILSIIGYNQVKNTTDNTSKNLAKAGIIISGIGLGIIAVLVFFYIFMFVIFLVSTVV